MDKPITILLAFHWYDRRVYKGIVRYATEHKWHLSPYLFSGHFVPHGWPADGAITCYGKPLCKFIDSLDMPKIDVTISKMEKPVPRVTVDNDAISQMAARHFTERGFKHFAFYSWPTIEVNTLRKNGFFKALLKAGVPEENLHEIHQSPEHLLGQWEPHQEHILKQIDKLPRPLAVFTGQDNLGATLIEICSREGIHVPEEISILGVDDIEMLCDCLTVPLSSIDTNLEKMGYAAARQLDRLMKKEITNDEPPVLIPPKEIVCRQSTDALAVPHLAVVQALKYIKEHFQEPITLEDIGTHAGMSKRGMEKAFLKHLGFSPATELRRIRLDTAKKLLTETDEKISAIAYDCGYSNSSNLSFAFNRECDMSPRTYRNRYSTRR
ncbi:MAG: DNA-binding transcriptional regulator [Verrucomicrobia bacterium]|nr:DNA-binding transcriptional regulator [Verrucomicrobiota bacterium]